jgi:CheY-like chemotaxis protein
MDSKNKGVNFIIIDDSELDCFIAEKMIKHSGLSNEIQRFLQAEQALEYIANRGPKDEFTVIVLDVLMPVMSGVEFVEAFEKLPEELRKRYRIIALTSSMNKKDMSRIKSFESVAHLFDKPLSEEALRPLLKDVL